MLMIHYFILSMSALWPGVGKRYENKYISTSLPKTSRPDTGLLTFVVIFTIFVEASMRINIFQIGQILAVFFHP